MYNEGKYYVMTLLNDTLQTNKLIFTLGVCVSNEQDYCAIMQVGRIVIVELSASLALSEVA